MFLQLRQDIAIVAVRK